MDSTPIAPSPARRHGLPGVVLALLPALALAQPTGPLNQDDITWLRRATFGPDSASIARYRELGRTRYLDEQLAARDDRLPPAIRTQIDGYEAIRTPPEQLIADFRRAQREIKAMPDGDAKVDAKKALHQHLRELVRQEQQAVLLHAIYGTDQLKEQLVWFWLNHFSVYAAKGPVHLLAGDYAEHVIRPHALGKFRDLVMATLESPAMLVFLDNAKNASGKINENYARELMELHTLGVNAGYTQQDVQQLALILTGVGIAPHAAERPARWRRQPQVVRHGLFVFNPRRHDFSDKLLLGRHIRGSGFAEVEQAVDLITRQPACARFISRQLAEYFVADDPPPALVAAMAQTFQRTDGDIAAVMRTLFSSPALTAGSTRKFKDPIRFVVSAMRLTLDGRPITNAQPLVGWLAAMGEPVFGRITPDGWPLDGASWSGSGQVTRRFDVAGAIGTGRNRLFAAAEAGPGTPPTREVPALDTPLFRETLAPRLTQATRNALGQAHSAQEWNTFLLSSPDFNYR